jgi:Enoyl-CoA hydratase/isomerase
MEELTDVRYEVDDGLAGIVIERPERLNAFRARTIDELIACFTRAWASPDVGVVCLTGAGDRAFCTGGDQKQRGDGGLRAVELGPVRGRAATRAHPRHPQAGDRGGQRLRDRGRACPARHLRPHDRRRHRPLRPDRPARGRVRRRLRHRLPGARDRREARPRGLDALPAVRRGDRGALGPGQHGRPGRRAARRGPPLGRRHPRAVPHRASSSSRSTSTPSNSRASASSRSAASACSSTAARRPRASRPSRRSAAPTSRLTARGRRRSGAPSINVPL